MASVAEYPQLAVVAAAGGALPRGLLFWPTDEELIQFFLLNRVLGRCLSLNQIQDMDVYSYRPDNLPLDINYELDTFGSEIWGYFFLSRELTNSDYTAPRGCWKATGDVQPVLGGGCCRVIGFKKNMVFIPDYGTKDKFVMEEYKLNPEAFNEVKNAVADSTSQTWVVCRISKILCEPWRSDDAIEFDNKHEEEESEE